MQPAINFHHLYSKFFPMASSPKALQIVGVVSGLLLILGGVDAFEFTVGGPRSSWTVPSDPNAAIYNHWAEKSRFQIGDTLCMFP